METPGDVQSIGSLSDGSELRSASSTALNEETCVVASGECRPGPRLEGRPAARKEDQQARYWSYLFDNLHRVVDEIYCTCEADQSVIECEVRTYVQRTYVSGPMPQCPSCAYVTRPVCLVLEMRVHL